MTVKSKAITSNKGLRDNENSLSMLIKRQHFKGSLEVSWQFLNELNMIFPFHNPPITLPHLNLSYLWPTLGISIIHNIFEVSKPTITQKKMDHHNT